MAEKKMQPFNDTPLLDPSKELESGARPDIVKAKELSIGEGKNVWRGDSQGMWLGAENFSDAPFRIDMHGNLYLISASGDGYLKIDAEKTQIIVNYKGVDQVVLGID